MSDSHGRRIIAEATAETLREMAAEILDRLASQGDNFARYSARVLFSGATGRVPIDDGEALAKVEKLALEGRPREAIGIVAREISASPKEAAAVERRLRRKRLEMKRTEGVCPRLSIATRTR